MRKKKMFRDFQKKGVKVKRLGFVNDNDMATLYSLASIYIYPSLYEGFGLPILEAQACGCPVISSNSSSMPEVGKDSVLYINPSSEKEILNALNKTIESKELRQDLISKGLKNISNFNWANTARKLYEEIKEIK